MKKITLLLMALCVALFASATPYHFAKQHSVDFGNLVSTQTVSEAAAGTPLQFDATETDGAAERTFTSQDDIELVSGTGFFQIIATAADGSDCLGLVLFANADPTTKVPVGTYPINGTEQAGSALASTGLKQNQLTFSFYAPKYNGGYIDLPIYWLVGGEVVVTCADNKLKFEVKAVNSNDVPVHVVCEYDLNAKQGMQYDEKKGDVNRTYTTEDILDIDTDYIAQYNLYVDIVAADYSDQVSLLFFVPAADPEIGIPAGTYPIVANPAINTVLASEGVTAQGGISPSFYGTLVEEGGELYLDKLWFFVSGQVVVENINGKLKMTIDAVNSYDVPVKIVYNADKMETHQLTVLSNDNAMGTVSGSGTYKQGQSVTISATANDGYHFSHWSDGNTDNPRVVQVTEDQTYTAYFAEDLYTITVVANNSEAGFTQGSGTYKYGTYTEIAATPNYGYHFSHWNDGNTENPRVVEITQDTTFTAYFKDNLYTISVDANNSEAGIVNGSGTYKYGTYTEIAATPNYGYHFSHWNDGETTNPRVIQVTSDMTYTAYFYKNTYTVSVDYNSAYGTVAGPTSGEYLDEITLTATPNLGYAFVKWSDGVTTNPRTIVLIKDMTLSAHFAQAYSGQCGNDLYWKYDPDAQTIAITGSGEMYHYTASTQPWILFKEQIRKVEISNEATSLGTSAFEGCRSLGEVHIGLNLLDIYENVFAGCKRLYHIYSYPTYPPFAESSSFANYSADLHIPSEASEGYRRDEVWGLFNIKFLGAETEDEVPSDEVTTTTTNTSVTITWPTDENADTYTIEIKRGDQVFCSLTFNKDGQLTNIAFAPSRDGQGRVQYAESTTKGLRFTVTNLNSGTQYSYDVTTKDENKEVIESYSGEFTTKSDVATDMDAVTATDNRVQKLFRNGQLIILRDGVEYNAMGQELGN